MLARSAAEMFSTPMAPTSPPMAPTASCLRQRGRPERMSATLSAGVVARPPLERHGVNAEGHFVKSVADEGHFVKSVTDEGATADAGRQNHSSTPADGVVTDPPESSGVPPANIVASPSSVFTVRDIPGRRLASDDATGGGVAALLRRLISISPRSSPSSPSSSLSVVSPSVQPASYSSPSASKDSPPSHVVERAESTSPCPSQERVERGERSLSAVMRRSADEGEGGVLANGSSAARAREARGDVRWLEDEEEDEDEDTWCRVWGLGLGFGVWGLGFGVWGLGFGVGGLGFGVWGLGLRA
ncbi:hypothetical protein T484DRAFT_3413351 [Baffinella frigidus]|nr:hypothetical protein T484DRAFT_3413351 [Cryptophyta sp. CCMP2293]